MPSLLRVHFMQLVQEYTRKIVGIRQIEDTCCYFGMPFIHYTFHSFSITSVLPVIWSPVFVSYFIGVA
jgi:hypothetical protein